MKNPNILDVANCVLVVVDMQDPLLKTIHEYDQVTQNVVSLIEAAKIFELPVLVTVQYLEKFGPSTQTVSDALPICNPINKMTFSCFGADGFPEALKQTQKEQVILCGVETHVCVNQTAHDLLSHGYQVHIISDAVSSRTPENKKIGLEKMRDSGCIISSTETAIFELTNDASSPLFKKILPLVK